MFDSITNNMENAMASRKKIPIAKSTASHSTDASEFLKEIRTLCQRIPGFVLPQTARATQRLSANAAVSDKFLEDLSVAIQRSAMLQQGTNLTPDEIRDVIRYSAAYNAVGDEFGVAERAVRHTIAVKRAEIGARALAAYNLAKALARNAGGEELLPYIAEMRKALNRKGGRKKAPEKPPEA